ncbi:MAG: hypothetical protein L3J34_02680 [Flavobacteriaceae bacterium]|nr:hypothetical protein [Flavobacteriaceae bacterium]
MKMLKYSILFVVIFLYNCDYIQKDKNNIPKEDKLDINIVEPVVNEKTKPVVEKKPTAITPQPKNLKEVFLFNDFVGKYPTQIKLFDNEFLVKRLKNLDRFNFDVFISNWNTETPISIENQIIHASGCKAHACPSNGYELFIDLKNDNINIFYFRGNTLKVYTENDWIDLPAIYQDELDIKKSNAKIGSTSDNMESIYTIYSKNNPKE